MKIPDKPRQQKNTLATREGLLNNFARDIVHGNVILLIGHESLLKVPSEEEANYDENIRIVRDGNGSMDKWMMSLQQRFYDPSSSLSLKRFFAEVFEDDSGYPRLEVEDMNPEILNLIKTRAFRIVLTTTFDPLVEEAMESAWGGKGSIDVRNFWDRECRDISVPDKAISTNDMKPTLYYLFGKATNNVSNYGNPEFVLDEEDYIKTISEWIKNPPNSFKSFIAHKRILAVGCKFEDWLFRFFWRAVLEARQSEKEIKHLLAVRLAPTPSDDKLREIFRLYNLEHPDDVSAFLNGLNTAILEQQKKAFEEERRNGGIFLSYCSKDYDKVLNLFYKLRDEGFNVWMDWKELDPGASYMTRIKDAIDRATVFMPVLSGEVASHLPALNPSDPKDPNYHFYRDFEWNYAVIKSENDKNSALVPLQILPFVLDDFSFRQNNVHVEIWNSYPEIFEKTMCTYDRAGYAKYIKKLKELIP